MRNADQNSVLSSDKNNDPNHFHSRKHDGEHDRECRAFYEIPDSIITGEIDHTKPYPGDNSIQFQLKEENREDFEEIQKIRVEMRSLI